MLAEQELELKPPKPRIGDVFAGLVHLVRKALVEIGGGIASLFPQRVHYGVSKAVTKPIIRAGPPARVPAGRRVYAIGDIHGRADLLMRLLHDLHEDIASGGFEGRPILIFLGDYVDRGFQSKDVINVLLSEMVSPFETYFLKGNHEAAMLQFLGDPSIGPRWAEFGGAETLVSYGVQPPRTRTSPDEWMTAAKALSLALPPEHLRFLNNLDLCVQVGDYVFVHAGVRPGVPLDQQVEQDLLWIREDFLGDRRELGAVIVHGHTPASRPYKDSRRVGLDTGAYLSGRLTAARFEHDKVDFIMTGPLLDAVPAGRG
jgi:serine/threonine protein phosphatase 1